MSKISYVKGFAPWGWIIGTGIYLDDVDAVFKQTAQMFALVCLAVFALVLISSFFIGRSVTRPLTTITNLTDRLASGDTAFEVPYTARKDEVGGLAKSLRVFKDNAEAIDQDACRAGAVEDRGRCGEAQIDDGSGQQVRSQRPGRRR